MTITSFAWTKLRPSFSSMPHEKISVESCQVTKGVINKSRERDTTRQHGKEALIMLMRTDPFRELDRLTQQVLGTTARPAAMPMDAYRQGDNFYICLDLPGIDPGSIDLTVEQNVLTVRADRVPVQADGAQMIVAERPYGTFTRQVFLGETLDADHIAADYAAGVLTLTIPVREAAKPRSIQVTSSDTKQAVTA